MKINVNKFIDHKLVFPVQVRIITESQIQAITFFVGRRGINNTIILIYVQFLYIDYNK